MLAERKGIPISLAILHAAVGRRAGLPIEFVGMPMHFMNKLRSEDSQQERFVDVFAGGRILDRSVCCLLASLPACLVRNSSHHEIGIVIQYVGQPALKGRCSSCPCLVYGDFCGASAHIYVLLNHSGDSLREPNLCRKPCLLQVLCIAVTQL